MAKLKNIIKQLSDKDYQAIYNSLNESAAEKSASLLKGIRERSLGDNKIMEELGVNPNAYYTLRSRLNQKIEEYLVEQMENPRTDILKKVANVNDVVFTKKRAIALATLKKLEKELIDYDLSSELTVVYKYLKRLHMHSPEQFSYSQLYNKHVAFMLATDKAEDILADYFKNYGDYYLTGDETSKLGLSYLLRELTNVSALHDSHRLYVYKSAVNIFHRLFVDDKESELNQDEEAIEDVLKKVESYFSVYTLDSIYHHLSLLFDYLKLEYYTHYQLYKKSEEFFDEVNDAVATLLMNYPTFTFSSQLLITKLRRSIRLKVEETLEEENQLQFSEYEPNPLNVPAYITYVTYRALSCYYAGNYDEAAKWINNFLNEVSLKKYPLAQLEIKSVLALQYCMMGDYDLFSQLMNSVQRQVRLMGKENIDHVVIFNKILKVATSEAKKQKADKISVLARKFNSSNISVYAPTTLIRMDEKFINDLSSVSVV
ncbi:MAG: hypothetical protein RIB71_09235 [Imperialibacter sp.]|uniref:hypothetical protein n=1 Tax=Imperialibacter sp. TaxID=2038411 RepID=UPI0032EDDD84